ncbi:MAG TPA: DUF4919 domain-containing protein [bacterium]|nr:DUF4919 domain-containing protein [bacterium]
MMSRTTVFVGLLWCSIWIGIAGAGFDGSDGGVEYYTKLRMDFAASKDFSPMWDQDPEREKAVELLRNGKTREGNTALQAYLKKNPVDTRIHLYCAVSAMELKDWALASKHLAIYHGLLASIGASASGATVNDPIKVISIQEEYDFLDSLNIETAGQSLISNDSGTPVDAIDCTLENESFVVYFDATIPMSYWGKLLDQTEDSEETTDPGTPTDPAKTAAEKTDSPVSVPGEARNE